MRASGVNSLVRQWWYQGQETLREPLGAGCSSIFAIFNRREPALEGGRPTAEDLKGFWGFIGDSVIRLYGGVIWSMCVAVSSRDVEYVGSSM